MFAKLIRFAAVAFPVFAIIDGAVCLWQPTFLREAMLSLSMPLYMLSILGAAKILGGAILLLPLPLLWREWAYAGFAVWWLGGIMAHVFNGDDFAQFIPLILVGSFLALSFLEHRPRRVMIPAPPSSPDARA